MATTALDIIKSSMRLLGVIGSHATLEAEETTDSLWALNAMLDQWSIDGLMTFYTRNETFAVIANTKSYSIGDGATWDTDRPARIESAFIRDSSNQDFPLDIITNAQYQGILQKDLEAGYPSILLYTPTMPNGLITLYGVPTSNMTCSLSMWSELSNIEELNDEFVLPKGYDMALRYNLAVEIAPEFSRVVSADIRSKAIETKAAIQLINQEVPIMRYDNALMRNRQYDINSDSFITEV